jgi:hypothetical protein
MALAGRSPSTSSPVKLLATILIALQQCLLPKMLKVGDATTGLFSSGVVGFPPVLMITIRSDSLPLGLGVGLQSEADG